MKVWNQTLCVGVFLLMTGCASQCCQQGPNPPTPLQLREVQSRTFEDCDTKSVMKAMIDVLQDEGYIVRNAVLDLGLLTAEKSVEAEDRSQLCLGSWIKGGEGRQSTLEVIEISANVSDFGSDTKVRLNFQKKTYDCQGGVFVINQVVDANHYQNFFAKVSKGIFLHSENL